MIIIIMIMLIVIIVIVIVIDVDSLIVAKLCFKPVRNRITLTNVFCLQ